MCVNPLAAHVLPRTPLESEIPVIFAPNFESYLDIEDLEVLEG